MKSINRLLTLFFALLLVTTAGCLDLEFLTFSHPSVAPENAKIQSELFGSYVVTDPNSGSDKALDKEFEFLSAADASDPKTVFLHIGRAGKGFPEGFLHFVSVNLDLKGKMSVDSQQTCFASKSGDCYILNLPLEKPKAAGEQKAAKGGPSFEDDEVFKTRATEWKPENFQDYWLFLLKPTEAGFALHLLDESFIKSEIAAGRLNGEFMTRQQKKEFEQKRKAAKRKGKGFDVEPTPFRVNAKQAELQSFFDKNIEKVGGEPLMFFRRVE